ncbi:RidA family protein [Streptomyces sp. NPDC093223]|uniref:RidA family protein n=1 Tax=Streptomyces sp. NPDC093223 TaxID=3366033 RepID=UPI00382A7667
MTRPEPINVGVSHQIGRYADAVRVPAGYDQVLVSGTPGLHPDGSLADDVTGQATQAWENVKSILERAGATMADIVSIRQWLTDADDIEDYVAVRGAFVRHECASMLAVIPALVWPSIKVEVEVVAVIPAAGTKP